MGFLLSYLMCFVGAFLIQTTYSKKMVKNHISFIAYMSFAFLISLWVFDALVIFGVLDSLILSLNAIPGVIITSGLDWYFNCLLLGLFNMNLPVVPNFTWIFFALILLTTYISFYRNGQGWGMAMFGKTAWQDGTLAQLGGVKKPDNWKEMEAKWEEGEAKRAANEEEANKLIEEGLELPYGEPSILTQTMKYLAGSISLPAPTN